jgi:HNH endonuclease
MLGSDKSPGYCLEMICANFLAGASLDGSNPEILLTGDFPIQHWAKSLVKKSLGKTPRLSLDTKSYRELYRKILGRDGWRCQLCGSLQRLQVHHLKFRSHSGSHVEQNLITLRVCWRPNNTAAGLHRIESWHHAPLF